jgi:hypothetical protein
MRRLERLLKRIEIEKYTSARLSRSNGLRWSWFGEVFEEVVASNEDLWRRLKTLGNADLSQMNERLKSGGKGLVNGYGLALKDAPEAFGGKVVIATDVWLVGKDGSRKKYVDRMLVSLRGSKKARWMASAADIEIKVPKKKEKLGPQVARAPGRRKRAVRLEMTIVDENGKVSGYEEVSIDRMVFNPSSTTQYGVSARQGRTKLAPSRGRSRAPGDGGGDAPLEPSEGKTLEPTAGEGRGGLAELHFREELPVTTDGAAKVINALFSRRALFGAR